MGMGRGGRTESNGHRLDGLGPFRTPGPYRAYTTAEVASGWSHPSRDTFSMLGTGDFDAACRSHGSEPECHCQVQGCTASSLSAVVDSHRGGLTRATARRSGCSRPFL